MAMMKPNETRFASPGSSSSLSDMALEAQNSPRAVIRTQQQGTSSSSRRGSPRSSTRTSSRPNSIVGGRAAVTAPVVPCSSAGRTPQTRRKELTPECEVRNAKFKELWDVKTIEQGMIRVPTKFLQDLIHNESIEKYFDIEEKPVARVFALC
ncbi:hypothetical protein TCAL_17092 [Tigriopus californicus]|uniref:Uncharacterized protein n=1 Tax=Tigriopus californicus TaxID=6832 RepID=A0A553PQZ5_TIGCA|nr:hypothetical protein TCAL_17092 [Tigriopus californicus]